MGRRRGPRFVSEFGQGLQAGIAWVAGVMWRVGINALGSGGADVGGMTFSESVKILRVSLIQRAMILGRLICYHDIFCDVLITVVPLFSERRMHLSKIYS